MSTAQQRKAATKRKRKERQRYKDANLAEILCRVPNNAASISELRALEKKLVERV